MPEPPYRALGILLRVFSVLAALGGLLLIFAEKPLIVRILLRPPEGEVSTLFLSTLKEMGGMVAHARHTDVVPESLMERFWVRKSTYTKRTKSAFVVATSKACSRWM